MNGAKMPGKKSQSKAVFRVAKKHLRLASGWQNEFAVMSSRANNHMYKEKREFFDKPVAYQVGKSTASANILKPMEVYH